MPRDWTQGDWAQGGLPLVPSREGTYPSREETPDVGQAEEAVPSFRPTKTLLAEEASFPTGDWDPSLAGSFPADPSAE